MRNDNNNSNKQLLVRVIDETDGSFFLSDNGLEGKAWYAGGSVPIICDKNARHIKEKIQLHHDNGLLYCPKCRKNL